MSIPMSTDGTSSRRSFFFSFLPWARLNTHTAEKVSKSTTIQRSGVSRKSITETASPRRIPATRQMDQSLLRPGARVPFPAMDSSGPTVSATTVRGPGKRLVTASQQRSQRVVRKYHGEEVGNSAGNRCIALRRNTSHQEGADDPYTEIAGEGAQYWYLVGSFTGRTQDDTKEYSEQERKAPPCGAFLLG